MSIQRLIGATLLGLSLITLSACEDAEKKAERKYKSAIVLLEAGEPEKADVELRGVFDLDPEHYEARMMFAQLRKDAGDLQQAVGHYRLAVEQHQDRVEPRIELAEILVSAGAWDDLGPVVDAAHRLAPELPRVQALKLAEEFRTIVVAGDGDLSDVLTRTRALLDDDVELKLARSLLVEILLRDRDFYGALEAIDVGIQLRPDDLRAHETRLRLLNQLGDTEAVGEQLRRMANQFPEREEIGSLLVRWYISQGDMIAADDYMRQRIDEGGTDVGPRVAYAQFLLQTEGPERAIEQLDVFIAEGTDTPVFRMLRASTRYDMGERDGAIADMEAQLVDATASDATRDQQIVLARMYLGTGEADKAHALVDTVLEQDNFHVDALKLRADRLIENDQVGDAILTLRSGQDQAPNDPDLFTLLAKAYERDGIRDLMGDNLSLAVEHSNARVPESLRYARFLMSEEKFQSARDVSVQSLRRNPSSLPLLQVLSEIYLGMADYPRAEQVVDALRELNNEQAGRLANGLEATILQRLQRTDESLALLRGMLEDDSTALVAQAAIIRTHLANGETEAARVFMDDVLADSADNPGVRFLNAALLSVEGEVDAALAIYRGLLDEDPQQEVVWRAYVAGLVRQEREDEALVVLDEAIETLPEALNLRWLKASYAEQRGKVDDAIEIYRGLYALESNSTIVANNLASLIATYRDDEQELQQAYVIARRLKDTTVPAFQDTYGWIAHRLGRSDEALSYLQDAAAGLPTDPLVREHYGSVLAALGRHEEAAAEFEEAIALIGDDRPDDVARLEAAISKAQAAQASSQ